MFPCTRHTLYRLPRLELFEPDVARLVFDPGAHQKSDALSVGSYSYFEHPELQAAVEVVVPVAIFCDGGQQ